MPDIAMCANEKCPLSKTCKRHEDSGTKPSDYWQSWADFEPENCEYYWPIKTEEVKK